MCVIGFVTRLSLAKNILNRYTTKGIPPRRFIFEVRNGKVDDDPRFIAGQYQFDRLKAGSTAIAEIGLIFMIW